MPPLDNRGSSESKVTADRYADTGTQPDCKTLVVAVTQTNTTAPIGTVAVIGLILLFALIIGTPFSFLLF